jgi:predicted dehydrogenase
VFSTQRIYPYIGAAGARLAGVCDLDRQKAERNARLFGGRTYTSYQQMVRTEEPDGVIVCVGARQHPELAMQLMEMNVPVYTEKPPSLDAAAALEVARKSGSKGVLCTTAFKKRYNLAYSRAREWINGFPQDDLYSLSIDFASAPYTNTFDQDSFILDFGIHAIDLVGWLFGDVSQVFAFAKSPAAYAVCLEFPHGAVGTMNLNDGHSFAHPTEEVEISVKGGNFMRVHNSSCWKIVEGERAVEWREPPTFVSEGDSGLDTGHLAEIMDFIAAIREGRKTRSDIYSSYKSMVLYDAIRKSAATGNPVTVEYETL